MFYAMTHGKVTIPGVRIEHVLEDIESLNRRAASTELEVTAVSCATYPAHRGPLPSHGPRGVDGEGLRPDRRGPGAHPRRGASRADHRHPGVRDHGVPAAPSRAGGPARDRGGVRPDPAGGGGRPGRRRPPDPRGADHVRRDGPLQGARPGRAVDEADGAATPAGRQRDAPRSGRGHGPEPVRGPARLDPLRPRAPGRGRGVRAPVRPRHRRRHLHAVRPHVRQRLHGDAG